MIRRGAWQPRQGHATWGERPPLGSIIGMDFRAWRVLDITDVLPIDPEAPQYILGCAPIGAGGVEGARHILTVKERPAVPGRLEGGVYFAGSRGGSPNFEILPEHFAVCGRCGDVQPCKEEWAEAQGQAAVQELMRYDQPGICPACQEPISLRQKSIDLPNVISPLGGIVTFHRRWRCLSSAVGYEKRALAAGAIQTLTLSCDGRLIRHRDQSLECLDLDCPDVEALHGNQQDCRYRSHGCPRLECQIGHS